MKVQKRHISTLSVSSAGLCIVLSLACGGGGGGTTTSDPPGSQAIISEDTIVLSEVAGQYLSSVSDDETTLTFAESTPGIEVVEVGDVIVSDVCSVAPSGFLRKVTAVQVLNGQTVLTTQQAALEDAVVRGSLAISESLTPADVAASKLLKGVVSVEPAEAASVFFVEELSDVCLYDADGDPATVDDQVCVSGSISFSIDFNLDIEVDDSIIQEIRFSVPVTQTADISILGDTSVVSASYQKTIAQMMFGSISLMIGNVPVVIIPVLKVNVGIEGDLSVGITARITQQAGYTATVAYNLAGGWTSEGDHTNEFGFSTPTLSSGCSSKAYLGPQLELLLYGIAGPYGSFHGYLLLDADPARTPWWGLYGGLEVDLGVTVGIMGITLADYGATAIDYSVLVAEADQGGDENQSPAVSDVTLNILVNASKDMILTGSDPDGDVLTFEIMTEPLHGTLSGFDATTGAVAYIPAVDYVGNDEIKFRAFDGLEYSGIAVVSITVWGGEIEIAYDDGTFDYSTGFGGDEATYAVTDNKYGFAVRFTPPVYPFIVTKVKLTMRNFDYDIHVHIWDDDGGGQEPGSELLPVPHSVLPLHGEWTEVDVSDKNLKITSGDFYVGFCYSYLVDWRDGPGNSIFSDTSSVNQGRSYEVKDYSWSSCEAKDGNLMIRAVGVLAEP